MKNLKTQEIDLPFEFETPTIFCAIRSIELSPAQTLYFTNYADTKYIVFNTSVERLSDEIRETLIELSDANVTNKNTKRSAVMKLVKKYAEFTINRTV
jgi:hypothetical protein